MRARFRTIDPYGDGIDLLELEKENFGTRELVDELGHLHSENAPRHLWCMSCSAKRYAIYSVNDQGIEIHKGLEHGPGCYLGPVDPQTTKPVEK